MEGKTLFGHPKGRWLGARKSVWFGCLLIMIGNFALVMPGFVLFYAGLALLALGLVLRSEWHWRVLGLMARIEGRGYRRNEGLCDPHDCNHPDWRSPAPLR